MSGNHIRSRFTVRDTDPLVRCHRVQDIHILPGVALLDAVYKTFRAAGIDGARLALRDVRFHEPVVTNDALDRRLTVTLERAGDGGQINVKSVPCKGDEPRPGAPTTHMTCTWQPAAPLPDQAQPAPALVGDSVDLDACYAVTRKIGINHDGFMKCRGLVSAYADGGFGGRIELPPEAAVRAGELLLHPVFLDCATIVPLFHLRARPEASLFIPFAIEEFRALSLTGQRAVEVRVAPPEADVDGREVVSHSFALFDLQGRPLVQFGNFTVKRVRSLAGIRRLLQPAAPTDLSAPSEPAAPATAHVALATTASAPAAPVAAAHLAPAGEPVLALVAELIAKHRGRAFDAAERDTPFFDLGLDSLALLELSEVLEKRLAIRLYPTVLFERPNVGALVAYLHQDFPEACAEFAARAATPGAAKVRPAGGGRPHGSAAPTTAARPSIAGTQPQILVPCWMLERPDGATASVARLGTTDAPATRGTIALIAGADDAGLSARLRDALEVGFAGDAAAFITALEGGLHCDEIWLCNVPHRAVFALAQALIAGGRMRTALTIKALTLNAHGLHGAAADEHAAHGAWGVLQSLSREYPSVAVAQIDLDRAEVAAGDTAWLSTVSAAWPSRTLRAVRAGRTYRRALVRAVPGAAADGATGAPGDRSLHRGFRRGGVYVVIGGAGGVGMELVRHLRGTYAAWVAVLGRRALDDELRARLAATGAYGSDVLYLPAAVDDEVALRAALETVTRTLGAPNGIVHSAMVLDDRRLTELDEASITRVLRPKVAGARALAAATADLPLDFVLYFSSVQSFVGNVTQANYATASTFLDGHAAALGARRRYPSIVINWGFFSEVGAVANERYRQLMARQGMHGLRSADAMAALDTVLAAGWTQAAVVAADQPVLLEMGLDPTLTVRRLPDTRPAPAQGAAPAEDIAALAADEIAIFAAARAANDRLLAVARPRVRRILDELCAGGSLEDAIRNGAIASKQAPLARALAALVARPPAADAASQPPGLDEAGFNQALEALAASDPTARDLAPLLGAAINAYPRVLAGRLPAAAALFPNGSTALVRSVYAHNAVSAFYNARLARAVAALPDLGRPLRILEIGAGTGATTQAVLDALAAADRPCRYVYTELWDKLVDEAKARLAPAHPDLAFAFLDIGADPATQGFADDTGGFDVVIATNVLHATRDLATSLRHAKQLLRAGGALLVNESVEVQEYSTYTFGLLPGWWNAGDGERLPASPLAAATRWPTLLREAGFTGVTTLVPPCPEAPDAGAQQIFCAASDGELCAAAATGAADSASPARLAAALALRPFIGGPPCRLLHTYQDAQGHFWVFLDNPPANTFNDQLLDELCATLPALTAGPEKARIIFLSHVGDYFSLGGDRSEIVRRLAAGDHAGIAAFGHKARALIRVITALDALVVAVVNGTAQGGGLETLLATDLQIVRRDVKLGLPEVKSGLVPGMGGVSYLKDLIGAPRTKRLLMQGGLVDADEAHAMGMISHVADDPHAAAQALGEELRHLEPALYMKRMLAPEIGARLDADIDAWITYLQQHSDWIDAERIANSRLLVAGRAALQAG